MYALLDPRFGGYFGLDRAMTIRLDEVIWGGVAAFLRERPLHHERTGATDIVIVTDPSGANRVYASAGERFSSYDGDRTLIGADDQVWRLDEDSLTTGDRRLARLPAHRAFWFGRHAAFPHTRLER